MEMTNIFIYGTLGGLLFLIIGAMLGYARREAQEVNWANASRDAFKQEREALRAQYARINADNANAIRELEIALVQAGLAVEAESNAFKGMKAQWVYADKYRKAIVNYMVVNHIWNFDVHSDDPMAMLAEIVKWETKMALDPLISKAAKNLHTRGVRKGAAMGRKKMHKLMQKSIDNQAMTIEMLQVGLKATQEDFDDVLKAHGIYRDAVRIVLDDKIALPGVRKSIKQAILTERDRLRSVHNVKGA